MSKVKFFMLSGYQSIIPLFYFHDNFLDFFDVVLFKLFFEGKV